MIAEVDVFGSRRVQLGSPATFEVEVSFAGEPYPDDAIAEVKYLVIDARGEIALTGWAEPLEDGLYRVTLSADDTAKLAVGVNRLEVVTVSTLVSIPTFESFEFVTTGDVRAASRWPAKAARLTAASGHPSDSPEPAGPQGRKAPAPRRAGALRM